MMDPTAAPAMCLSSSPTVCLLRALDTHITLDLKAPLETIMTVYAGGDVLSQGSHKRVSAAARRSPTPIHSV